MECDEPDDLDKMIAERTEANPDFPAMVAAAAAALCRRRAKLDTGLEGSPDITEEELVDDVLACRERLRGSPS